MKKLKILKFMPKNLKTILIIIINDIIISGTLVFAYNNYLAKDVEYEKNDGTKISVENALNELYAGNKDSANNNYMFVYNKVANKNYTLNTGNTENRSGKWEFNDKGLDLYISSNYDSSNDTDAKYTYWCYIPQKNKNPRRLTPRECARLQGFPDSFLIPVSDTQAYKQFGNSVVVPLIAEVASLIVSKIKQLEKMES